MNKMSRMGRGSRLAIAACAVGVGCFGVESQAGLIIDDFTVGPVVLFDDGTTGPLFEGDTIQQNGLNTAHVAAGNRFLEVASDGSGASGGTTMEVDTSDGVLRATSDPGFAALVVEIQYDFEPLAALDLTNPATSVMELDFSFVVNDLFGGDAGLLLRLADAEGNTGGVNLSFDASDTPFTVSIPFTADAHSAGSINLAQITRVRFFDEDFQLGQSFEISEIRLVPEPGAAAIALVMAGMTAMRRRRSS